MGKDWKRTHKIESDPGLEIVPIRTGHVSMRYGTHLTVNRRANVHTEKGEYRTHKASHSRDGVNLSNQPGGTGNQGEGPIATDPYRTSVGDMAPKGPPFIVEGNEELPSAHASGWL
jgi:hypothetical protein